jgi:hypothetical protein
MTPQPCSDSDVRDLSHNRRKGPGLDGRDTKSGSDPSGDGSGPRGTKSSHSSEALGPASQGAEGGDSGNPPWPSLPTSREDTEDCPVKRPSVCLSRAAMKATLSRSSLCSPLRKPPGRPRARVLNHGPVRGARSPGAGLGRSRPRPQG